MAFNKFFLLTLPHLSVLAVSGQGTTETMLQQIAALQTYIRLTEQGYRDTEEGLATIKDIRQGELNLHTAFFQSLSTISPEMKKSPDVVAALYYQQSIMTMLSQAISNFQTSPWLQPIEKSYWQR